MGSLYRPKYRNAAGELVDSSVCWCKFYVNGKPVRMNTKTDRETLRAKFRAKWPPLRLFWHAAAALTS
jgi:hypothetical protein